MHRRQAGRGKVWNWIKKAAGTVGRFIKDNKLISKSAAFLATKIGGQLGAALGSAGTAAGAMGLGRRRRRGGALRLAVIALAAAYIEPSSRRGRAPIY